MIGTTPSCPQHLNVLKALYFFSSNVVFRTNLSSCLVVSLCWVVKNLISSAKYDHLYKSVYEITDKIRFKSNLSKRSRIATGIHLCTNQVKYYLS